MIRTKTLNALITSRLRMDFIHETSVGEIITTFELDQNTAEMLEILFEHQINAKSFANENGDSYIYEKALIWCN